MIFCSTSFDKPMRLTAMRENFGLRYEIIETSTSVNATGGKPHYYSLNTRAGDFGYQPVMTSLEGLLQEATAILQKQTSQAENN